MKFKKIMLVTIILLAILTISAVSANEGNVTSNDLTANDNFDIDSSIDEKDLFFENPVGNFSELSGLIEDVDENDTLELDRDFLFDRNANSEGINIAKSMTIDGKGHTISADYRYELTSTIFNIDQNSNVIFKNINFKDLSAPNRSIIRFESSGTLTNCSFDNCMGNIDEYSGVVSFGSSCTVVNCTFSMCTAGAINTNSGIFINNTFTDCKTDYCSGGAIRANSGTFINNTFTRCKTEHNRGGGIITTSATLINNTFIGCEANDEGSAVYIDDGGNIINCNFINCLSSESECAVYIRNGDVDNCSFINCLSGGSDNGALCIANGDVNNCTFINCSSDGRYAGAIYMVNGDVNNCTFIECFVNSYSGVGGGAVYIEYGNVNNCTFMNCSSKGDHCGGAIFARYNAGIFDCNFVNCLSKMGSDKSYAIFYDSYSITRNKEVFIMGNCNFVGSSWISKEKLEIHNVTVDGISDEYDFLNIDEDYAQINFTKNCTIENSPILVSGNNVVIDGKGHYVKSDVVRAFEITGNGVTIKNINFRDDTELHIQGDNCNIINCTFFNFNGLYHRILDYDWRAAILFNGYPIYKNGQYVSTAAIAGTRIINCSFGNVSGETGSCIHFADEALDIAIHNCSFIKGGIAIDFDGQNNCNISNCDFIRCSYAVELTGDNVMMSNCNFINCTTTGYYRSNCALYLGRGSYIITNCSFENCKAIPDEYAPKTCGGAIYCDWADCVIINCRFKNNFATEASAIYFEIPHTTASIINTTFEGNDWFCDKEIELSNVTVDGVKVSLWDSLEEYGWTVLNEDCEVLYSSIPITKNNVVIDGNGHTIKSIPYWALYITGSNVTLKNFTFIDAKIYSDSDLTIMDCNFVNFSSNYQGGLKLCDGKMINCNFTNCACDGSGFVIVIGRQYPFSIINCNFINESQRNMICAHTPVDIINSTFINCPGCAILLENGLESLIDSCSFVNCSGGAVNSLNCYLSNSNFINCSSDYDGGALHWSLGPISNCSFVNCFSKGLGGAIKCANGYIYNCTFENCRDDHNNAIYFDGIISEMSNISFMGCHWASNRNIIDLFNVTVDNSLYSPVLSNLYEENDLTIEINFSEICYAPININGNNIVIDGKGNTLRGNGNNILYITGNNVVIKNLNFENGGIYSKKGSDVINCTFNNLKYLYDSRAIYNAGNVVNCSFTNCYGSKAIYKAQNIINCSFTNCSTNETTESNRGGAIDNAGNVVNCSFTNCRSNDGGAVYAASLIVNCTFTDIPGHGEVRWGGVSRCGSIINSTFNNCPISIGQSGNSYGCTFINCTDTPIYTSGDVSNCTFINCYGFEAGAIYNSGTLISFCNFINCSINSYRQSCPGVILLSSKSTVLNCTFIDCNAFEGEYNSNSRGGAIFVDTEADIINCSFTRCSANNGGAIYIYSFDYNSGEYYTPEVYTTNIVNCSFADCFTRGHYEFNWDIGEYDYCDVTDNAIHVCYYKRAVVVNCSFVNNSINFNTGYGENCRLENSTFYHCGWTSRQTVDVYNVTAVKFDSHIYASNQVFNYSDCYLIEVTLDGAESVNVRVIDHPEAGIHVNKNRIEISYLDVGNYTLNITTIPKAAFNPTSVLINMTVNNAVSTIELFESYIDPYSHEATYGVFYDGAYDIECYINSSDADVTVDWDTIIISGLKGGNYTLYISTVPYENYESVTLAVDVIIPKWGSSLSLDALDIKYGETTRITVDLDLGLDANITLELDGQNYTKLMSGGKAEFNIPGLKSGQYTVKATFDGNEEYDMATASATFEVSKVQATCRINETISDGNFTAQLPSDATGTLSITIDSKTYSAVLVNGQAKIDLSGLGNGTYLYDLAYSGDDNYCEFANSNNILTIDKPNVEPIIPEITIPSLDNVSGEGVVSVSLPVDATGTVTLTVNGKDYVFWVMDGKADVILPDLANGDYSYTLTYSGDGKYSLFCSYGIMKVNNDDVSGNGTSGVNGTGNATVVPEVVIPPLDELSGDGSVPITLPSDATGTVTLSVNDKDYVFDVVNGKADVKLPDLANGDYQYTITYSGDSKYSSFSSSGSLIVNNSPVNGTDSNSTSGNATNTNITDGNGTSGVNGTGNATVVPEVVIPPLDELSGDGSVPITLPSDATGTVTLSVNDKDYVFDVVNGKADVKLPDLANGNYQYTITYSGDSKYSSFSSSGSMKVISTAVSGNETSGNGTGNNTEGNATGNGTSTNTTVQPEIVVPPLDEASDNGTVTVSLPSDATGTVTLAINGKEYVFDVMGGKADVRIPELSDGNYNYTITYSGDGKYSSFTSSDVMVVNNTYPDPGPALLIPDVSIPSLDGALANGYVIVSVPGDVAGKVALSIDGKDYIFDVVDGKANVTLPDLANGYYDYSITYYPDGKYANYTDIGILTVNRTGGSSDIKPTPEIVVPPLDKPSSDGSVAIALPSDATGKVTLTINGKDYNYLVENGVANVVIPNLGEGNYPYTITYSGDGKYSSFTSNGTLTKEAPKVDPVITAKDANVLYTSNAKYSVTVYGTDGKLAKNTEVIFKINGKQVAKGYTNANGVATYTIKSVPGKYTIVATALGTSVSNKLTVKSIVTLYTTTFKKSAKKITFKAKLAKVNGKVLKKKTITFKVNGKKVATAKTDKNGVAKITLKDAKATKVLKTLKAGKKVTYQATYLKDTVKKTTKAKK